MTSSLNFFWGKTFMTAFAEKSAWLLSCGSAGFGDAYHGIHAGAQDIFLMFAAINTHANRNALHDFGEVAGGIVRGQQGELGAGGGSERFYFSCPLHARLGIDF